MHTIQLLGLLSLALVTLAGCAAPEAPAAIPPTPTVVAGWERYFAQGSEASCGFAIDHPADMEVTTQGDYSWILSFPSTDPGGPVPNFIYVSVIPEGFRGSEGEVIYNYEPAEAQSLLSLQVGESRLLRDDPTLAPWFSYTRLPDTPFGSGSAKTYENTQPWEFPPGTKEIRHYLPGSGCTYLVGGYMATVGSGQPGSVDQNLFERILAAFQANP